MNDTRGFFQLTLIGFGVMVVFALIANMTSFGFSGPWTGENSVTSIIAPLILVICFLGFVAYVVTHR